MRYTKLQVEAVGDMRSTSPGDPSSINSTRLPFGGACVAAIAALVSFTGASPQQRCQCSATDWQSQMFPPGKQNRRKTGPEALESDGTSRLVVGSNHLK